MATPAVISYREASSLLMEQARTEFLAGDLRQASEKGWGAAAQIIKAVSEDRGLDHYAHYLLIRAVSSLIEETGDHELYDLFGAALNLHNNFYENWLPIDQVQNRLQRVEQFVAKLDALVGD